MNLLMSVDEAERVMELLINNACSINECPYCGFRVAYCDGNWTNQHSPIVRVYADRIEAGYYCGKSGKEVILLTIDRRSGGVTEVYG